MVPVMQNNALRSRTTLQYSFEGAPRLERSFSQPSVTLRKSKSVPVSQENAAGTAERALLDTGYSHRRSLVCDRPHFEVVAATRRDPRLGTVILTAAATVCISLVDPAAAIELHAEPSNALSLPTWAVHTSSVIEWVTAMGMMWRYAEVTGRNEWKGMTWGMLPCMGSALCACTWHFFYNAPELDVRLSAFCCAVKLHLILLEDKHIWYRSITH